MGNTEGSQAIKLEYTARKNMRLYVTKHQMQVLIGTILGDAYIYPQGKICIEHCQAQKEYLLWKYQQLKSLAYPKIAQVTRRDMRINKNTVSWRFFLKQYFRPLRTLFYPHNNKIIPTPALTDWLTPAALAVWYMDDGYLAKGKYPIIMTESYSRKSLNSIAELLKEKYSLYAHITPKQRLRIKSSSAARFLNVIEPHIHKAMSYKLP